MPTKKRTFIHTKKKPVQAHKQEVVVEEKPQEAPEERPVMQVVQVPQETTPVVTVTQPTQESTTPVVAVTPEGESGQPMVTEAENTSPKEEKPEVSAAVVAPQKDAQPKPEGEASKKSEAVSQPPVATPVAPGTSSATETFFEGLPEKSSSSKGVLIVILVLLLLVLAGIVGGYIYWAKGNSQLSSLLSIPSFLSGKKSGETTMKTITPTTGPTPTAATVNKSAYTIAVLNGSGISGSAAKLKDVLTTDGFVVSTTGNADTSDNQQTSIAAKKTVSPAFLSALKTELQKTYVVSLQTGVVDSTQDTDIVVTIGSQSN